MIEPERHKDDRGYFTRTYCEEEFSELGLHHCGVQCNVSGNTLAGTLRGLHYQRYPHAEAKLIRCTSGEIFDVIVDLRRDSTTFGEHTSVSLSARNQLMLYVPEGFAHGFQTVTDGCEVFYQMSTPYHPDSAAGIHYADPHLSIAWPLPISRISDSDRSHPEFSSF